jgi:para-nitrobenzyl esterase
MKPIITMLVALAAVGMTSAVNAQTVAVTGGQIRGAMLEQGGVVFKGIPFAAPPVGELRWREPMPVKPWTGVRDATAFGSICPQKPRAVLPNAAEIAREDCLFLNIWAAEWPSKSPKPVMIWIPGGGNFYGGGTAEYFDGERLARRGVVLVTLNYRVGSFGFFSHPALTRESPHRSSGNQGILDQIAALKWVHDNIANFGGDPNNVTIFGESAGSLDVNVLMTSPLSRGLFQRVIGESGAVILLGHPLTLSQAEERGRALAGGWPIPANPSAQDLRSVSMADILQADPDFSNAANLPPNLGITIDGYVFPVKPAEVFASYQQHRVALLLGSNARERIPGTTPPTDLAKAIDDEYGPLAKQAQALYVGGTHPLYGTPAEQWATDTSFRCSAVAQLAWHVAADNPAFHFEFARVPPGREAVGATHASELNYVFGTLDRWIFNPRPRLNEVDQRVSDAMQQYWTNFAKTGDPNGAGLPVWPKFDATSRAYIQFTDAGPIAKEGLRRPYCELFIENVRRQMAR